MSNKKVIGNFLWRFAERCGAQLVTFIVSIVLARILVSVLFQFCGLLGFVRHHVYGGAGDCQLLQ